MFPDTSPGSIVLTCWAYTRGAWRECFITEADATTQTVEIHVKGTIINERVPFSRVQNVALKYAISGHVLQNFGAPRIHRPESIAYIQYATV
jgi:hypothetical protein